MILHTRPENLRNKRVGLERHKCIKPFEQSDYSGENKSKL